MLTSNLMRPGDATEGSWWIEQGRFWEVARDSADGNPNAPFNRANLTLPFNTLGLARLRIDPEQLEIAWDIDRVDPASLDTAMSIATRRRKSVTLFFSKDGWARERFDSREAALDRARELQSFRTVPWLATTRIDTRPLSEIADSPPELREAYANWSRARRTDDVLAGPQASKALAFGFNGDGRLAVTHFGEGADCRRILDPDRVERAVGRPYDSVFGDQSYEDRVSAGYLEALSSGEPILQDVLAHIDLGPHPVYMKYKRVILPDPDAVVCVARLTEKIQIPFLSTAAAQAS